MLHLTSAKELSLFTASHDLSELKDKNITAEVCVHHLFFNEADYETQGSLIKCNPAVKSAADQQALLDAVRNDVLDIIATDHAPHTWEEKQNSYFKAPSGVPLVQHSLQALLELYHNGVFTLETIVKKTSHAVAERFQVQDRGYIREGISPIWCCWIWASPMWSTMTTSSTTVAGRPSTATASTARWR